MIKIIGDENKVHYGVLDDAIEWNYEDFKLYSPFGKELKGLRKKWRYHQFNYIGFLSDDFFIGLAAVDLGYGKNFFAFHYDIHTKQKYYFEKRFLIKKNKLTFDRNPEEGMIEYKDRNSELLILKSHQKEELEIHCNFESKLIINAVFPYSLKDSPLRVLNPVTPTAWMFTEKYASLQPSEIDICLNGKMLPVSKRKVSCIYDWSGGYPKRETDWFWSCFGGYNESGIPIGVNFATLVNESFYPENAVWIDKKRKRVSRIIFDFDANDPFKPWSIYDEGKEEVDLTFVPCGEHQEQFSAKPLTAIFFRQLIGHYSGNLTDSSGKKVDIGKIAGFAEIHNSVW